MLTLKQVKIDGAALKIMFLSGTQYLETHKQAINALNVFPVPDGDTGTNMSLTMLSAAKEMKTLPNNDMSLVADALSRGSLKGARGNSGVILSQLFRGFARSLKGETEVTTRQYAEALKAGVETAYKAVMKPVEGTILTVARVTAEEATQIAEKHDDFGAFFTEIIKVAKVTLDNTPELLPVLKQAGVVDAGGMGLLYIMMGCKRALDEDFDLDMPVEELDDYQAMPEMPIEGADSIEFGYCTEFFVKNLFPYITEADIEKLKEKLDKLGDSVVVVGDEDLIKVHFHTNMPGKGLQLGLRFGELSSIKIDNMREQHTHVNPMEHVPVPEEPKKEFGILSVAMGKGIAALFKDLAVDHVIEGGQTMNPSIEDILMAADRVSAKELFVLPNNSNIVLSANHAAQLSSRPLHVIPSKSIPQGMAAMLAYNPDHDAKTNVAQMTAAMGDVKSGQVTYAVRNSQFDGITITEGDIIGLYNGKIVTAGKLVPAVTQDLLNKMLEDGGEIVTVLFGHDVVKEQADELAEFLNDSYPDVDVEVFSGGQPLYYYILSVE